MSVNNFFLAQRFAVAGASNDVSKYGYKVLKWYTIHDLPVTPINPVRLPSPSPTLSLRSVDC